MQSFPLRTHTASDAATVVDLINAESARTVGFPRAIVDAVRNIRRHRLKKTFRAMLLSIILAGCGAAPVPTPKVEITSIPAATQTSLPTNTATAIPTPTIVQTPTTSSQVLEQQAAELCEKAFSAPVETGEIKMPYLGMSKTEFERNPVWHVSNSIPHVYAYSAESVQSIICSLETRQQVGTYTDGSAAFKLARRSRVLTWPDGKVIASQVVESGMPPKTKTGFGGGYGSYPEGKSETEWILGQVEHPDFLYVPGRSQNLLTVALSPRDNLGATSITEKDVHKILLFDWAGMIPVTTLEYSDLGKEKILVFSPDGNLLVSAGDDRVIRFWDLQRQQQIQSLQLEYLPTKILYARDGKSIAVATNSATYMIDANTLQIKWSLPGNAYPADLAFSTDSRHVFINGPLNDKLGITQGINVIDAETGQQIALFPDMSSVEVIISPEGEISFDVPFPTGISNFILSRDGSQIISFDGTRTADYDPLTGLPQEGEHTFALWDADSGKYLFTVAYTGLPIQVIAFSPDGKYMATGNERNVWLWDSANWTVIKKFIGHVGKITDLAFTPDGRNIITSSMDATIRIWSLEE